VTLEQGIAFFVFSIVAAITPGPSNLMLTAAGAIAGVVRGLPCLLGVAVGMGLLIFSVTMGLGQLILGHAVVLRALNWLGAALFQWINPKSWLVSGSAAGAYLQGDANGALLQAVSFAAVFVSAALPSGFVWLAFGASMHRTLRSARAARIFNSVMGASLAASVVMILW